MNAPFISPELRGAVETVLAAQAHERLTRFVVETYQRAILAEHCWPPDACWQEKRFQVPDVILEPESS